MNYKVKILNKTITNKKVNETDRKPHISIPFIVESLGLSDNVIILTDEFTIPKAKTIIKQKIRAELARLSEHIEYQVNI